MKITISVLVFLLVPLCMDAREIKDEGYVFKENISYVDADEKDAYRRERCVLDLYYPENAEGGYPTLVWFHGGGLEGGHKDLRDGFRRQGFAVVSVNYRLFPKCSCPDYIDDAALALAWTYRNISKYGGTPQQIYVGGHSAGGYLALMVALAKHYTAQYGFDADLIAKAYPVSGQTVTHYTIRKERGLPDGIPVIDSLAPIANVRKEGAPIVLFTGGRDREMLARYEENAHLHAILRHFGHPSELFELEGFDHVTVLQPAEAYISSDIRRLWKECRTYLEGSW